MRRVFLVISCFLLVSLAAADEAERTAIAPEWPALKVTNVIDERVFARLRELAMVPSPLTDDASFLRRLSLVTIGQLPTAAEVRAFIADDDPQKRSRKIDELVEHKLHAALWATRFCELTGNSLQSLEGPDELKPKRAKMWHDWLRRRFEENMRYDKLVRGILTATSRAGADIEQWIDEEASLVNAARGGFDAGYADRAGLDLFWRRDPVDDKYPTEQFAERIASSFMGIRINCARCHNHPFDHWKQQDYRQFVAVFGQVRFDMSSELRMRVADRIEERRRRAAAGEAVGLPLPRLREVYVGDPWPSARAAGKPVPKALGGPELAAAVAADVSVATGPRDFRVALMDWLNDPKNPFFARNAVNRVWAHHFGRGLVEPLDGFSAANPPSHPGLLDELAADFVEHGYDFQRLERLILNSATWQLSSKPNDVNRADRSYFSRAYVRIPPAETIIDMWRAATGIALDFGAGVPKGIRAVEIPASRLGDKRWDGILDLFGHSARTQTCDCGQSKGPSIRQTLALMSDANLLRDLSQGELAGLLGGGLGSDQLLDELFLRTLSRPPTDLERSAAMKLVSAAEDQRRVFEDILWGLVNSQEFITNH